MPGLCSSCDHANSLWEPSFLQLDELIALIKINITIRLIQHGRRLKTKHKHSVFIRFQSVLSCKSSLFFIPACMKNISYPEFHPKEKHEMINSWLFSFPQHSHNFFCFPVTVELQQNMFFQPHRWKYLPRQWGLLPCGELSCEFCGLTVTATVRTTAALLPLASSQEVWHCSGARLLRFQV